MKKLTERQKEMNAMFQIEGLLEIVYTAHCTQCGQDQSDNTDESAFAEKLYRLGWRSTDQDDLYCPDCAKSLT